MTNLNSLPDMYLQSNFPKWIFWSRVSQFVLSLFVFALGAYAISEFKIGSAIGVPSFVGLNMFTALVTIIIVPYTFIAPSRLPSFYHVYGEVALELFLLFFWLVSFATMANYIGTFDWNQAAITQAIADLPPDIQTAVQAAQPPWLHNIHKGVNALDAVTVFGSVLFILSLANFIFLVAHVIKMRRARQATSNNLAGTENEMERAEKANAVSPDMPPSFA